MKLIYKILALFLFKMTYYCYLIHVGLENVPEEAKTNPKIYKSLLEKIVNSYQDYKEIFVVGKTKYTEPGGYGCGPNEFFDKNFSKFSTTIKDVTFKVYFSFWNESKLYVIKYKNGKNFIKSSTI